MRNTFNLLTSIGKIDLDILGRRPELRKRPEEAFSPSRSFCQIRLVKFYERLFTYRFIFVRSLCTFNFIALLQFTSPIQAACLHKPFTSLAFDPRPSD